MMSSTHQATVRGPNACETAEFCELVTWAIEGNEAARDRLWRRLAGYARKELVINNVPERLLGEILEELHFSLKIRGFDIPKEFTLARLDVARDAVDLFRKYCRQSNRVTNVEDAELLPSNCDQQIEELQRVEAAIVLIDYVRRLASPDQMEIINTGLAVLAEATGQDSRFPLEEVSRRLNKNKETVKTQLDRLRSKIDDQFFASAVREVFQY